jgi:hypothetical protein
MSRLDTARFIAVFAVTMVTGCAPAATQTTSPEAASSSAKGDASLAAVTEAVLADAAKQTGVGKGSLVVVSSESVVWSDGSLGCPQPGIMYTQALVPGYRIKVRAGQTLLDYHATANGNFVLCPPGRGVDPVDGATR